MKNFMLACSVILMFGMAGCVSKISPEDEAAAVERAKAWLVVMDAGRYADGWRQASKFLRESVSEDKWMETMQAVRKPMGSLVTRKVKSTKFRRMMAHALKGKYLIIDFKTAFSKKPTAAESITQIKEKDGVWRVGGYHIE
jgi:Protein of unknown function (DUF4019)